MRSYSMNGFVGDILNISKNNSPGYRRFLKTSDCLSPGPSMTFVLLDECPDSINDDYFSPSMVGGSSATWTDVPWHALTTARAVFLLPMVTRKLSRGWTQTPKRKSPA